MDDIQACRECGYRHPPTPPGECPMAKESQIKNQTEQLGNDKAVKYMQAIQIKLLDKLKSLPEEGQNELSNAVFQLIEHF